MINDVTAKKMALKVMKFLEAEGYSPVEAQPIIERIYGAFFVTQSFLLGTEAALNSLYDRYVVLGKALKASENRSPYELAIPPNVSYGLKTDT